MLVNYETTWYPSTHAVHALATEARALGAFREVVVHAGHRGPREIGVQPDGAARFAVGLSVDDEAVFSSRQVQQGQWVHLVGVFRPAETLEIWMNGELAGSRPAPPEQINGHPPPQMGHKPNGSDSFFLGRIDDARIYARALQPGEIAVSSRR